MSLLSAPISYPKENRYLPHSYDIEDLFINDKLQTLMYNLCSHNKHFSFLIIIIIATLMDGTVQTPS